MAPKIALDIAAYDDDIAISGPASWAARMPSLLRERGIDVRVLMFQWGCGDDGMLARHYRDCCIPYETQRFTTTEENVRWLLTQVHAKRPDIFVCNHVVPALLIGGTLNAAGIPTVGILRSDDPFYHAVIDNFVAGRPQDRLSAVVGVSRFLTNLVLSQQPSLLVDTISSGTPLPSASASFKLPLHIVYAGRFEEEQKRIHLTAQSIIRACRDVHGTTATMIGEGTQLETIRDIVYSTGLPITITGRLDPSKATSLIQQAQLQVLFSEYEGLPTSILEGMSAGVVPICTSMRSGIDQLVEHQKTGFIVTNPLQDLTPIVQELSRNRFLWERVSKDAMKLVQAEYSIDHSANRWCQLIGKILVSRKGKSKVSEKPTDLCPFDPRLSREDNRVPIHLNQKKSGTARKLLQLVRQTLRYRHSQ
jgi:glycosyltransferase involved in cell wall biosynthesis